MKNVNDAIAFMESIKDDLESHRFNLARDRMENAEVKPELREFLDSAMETLDKNPREAIVMIAVEPAGVERCGYCNRPVKYSEWMKEKLEEMGVLGEAGNPVL